MTERRKGFPFDDGSTSGSSTSQDYLFGSGVDGNVTLTSGIIVGSKMYNNLTINGTVRLSANEPLFVKDTLTINGTLTMAGTNASPANEIEGGRGGETISVKQGVQYDILDRSAAGDNDGNTGTLTPGTVANANIEFDGAFAGVPPSLGALVDGMTIIIDDGTNSVTFEFDDNASVTGGNTAVTLDPVDVNTATNFMNAVNVSVLDVTASLPGSFVHIDHNQIGAGLLTITGTALTVLFNDFTDGTDNVSAGSVGSGFSVNITDPIFGIPTLADLANLGQGGNGGAAGLNGAAVNVVTFNNMSNAQRLVSPIPWVSQYTDWRRLSNHPGAQVGASGSTEGDATSGGGGGAGGSGGLMHILAKNIVNNGSITANGGNGSAGGAATNYSTFRSQAQGTINTTLPIVDGDTITIDDGAIAVTFEADNNSIVGGGNTAVTIDTSSEYGTLYNLYLAILASGLNVRSQIGFNQIEIIHNDYGAINNIPMVTVGASFSAAGLASGADGVAGSGTGVAGGGGGGGGGSGGIIGLVYKTLTGTGTITASPGSGGAGGAGYNGGGNGTAGDTGIHGLIMRYDLTNGTLTETNET